MHGTKTFKQSLNSDICMVIKTPGLFTPYSIKPAGLVLDEDMPVPLKQLRNIYVFIKTISVYSWLNIIGMNHLFIPNHEL
jgi:hypothetical protein